MANRTQNSSLPMLSCADGIAASTSDAMLLIARMLLGWIFVRSGYGKLFDIAAYSNTFPGRGLMPALAYLAVPVEFFGGVALLLGVATRYVTTVMIAFMLIATFSSHRYWEFTDATVRRFQDASFWKNIAMLGGFCALFVSGPGRLSADNWLRGKG